MGKVSDMRKFRESIRRRRAAMERGQEEVVPDFSNSHLEGMDDEGGCIGWRQIDSMCPGVYDDDMFNYILDKESGEFRR